MHQLSEELAKPMINIWYQNLQVRRHYNTKIAIESVIGQQSVLVDQVLIPSVERDSSGRKKITGSFHICYQQPTKKRRKTRKSCPQCNNPVCDEHSFGFVKCVECNI